MIRRNLDGSREEEGGDDDDDDDDEGQKGMEKKESWFEKTVVITAFRKMKEFFIIVRVRSQDDRSLAGAFTNLMTGIHHHHHHHIKFLSSSSYPEYQFGTCQRKFTVEKHILKRRRVFFVLFLCVVRVESRMNGLTREILRYGIVGYVRYCRVTGLAFATLV